MTERYRSVRRRLVGQKIHKPPAAPLTTFGTALTLNYPRMPESTGTNYYVSPNGSNSNNGLTTLTPWLTIAHAFANVSLSGGIINLMSGTFSGTGDITWSRAGSSSNPVTLQALSGAVISGFRLMVSGTGSYIRFRDLDSTGAHDAIKLEPGSHHIEVDGCTLRDTAYQGMLIGSGGNVTDVQVWNTRFQNNGDHADPQAPQHGIYSDNVTRMLVANCLFYDYDGFALHFYNEGGTDITVVNCTCDETTGANGGPVVFDISGLDVALRGCILTDSIAGYEAIRVWTPAAVGSVVSDCVAFDVSSPAFPTQSIGGSPANYTQINNTVANPLYVNKTARNYNLQAGSPAINRCASRPEWVPPTDIDGTLRVTADAGCFAYTG